MSAVTLSFLSFALVASLSPGPSNVLILAEGARVGTRRTLPLVLAACVSAAAVVLVVGLGLGAILVRHPLIEQAMAWFGVAWLSLMAWRMLRAAGQPLQADAVPRHGLASLAALQVINPKVWVMAMAVIGVFALPSGQDPTVTVAWLSAAFLLVAVPCMTLWAVLGAASASWLSSPRALKRLNQALAILLLASGWSALWL
ncbi:LysE family translocator [Pseudomonas entomophila]|uniref:LysE family translocator n=1 Tax=Pseudomonas entomophila TaxID=312306 RepID=UPI003EBEEC6E